MKIFLDVGAHEGQTLSSILDPKYSFDMIFVFEPVRQLHIELKKIAAGRQNVTLLEYGLWNQNITQKIYSPGTVAGSIFAGHQDVDKNAFVLCDFVNASEWFSKNISPGDEVYVKLNCEGAEADILLDLLKSKEIFKVKDVMIDFDVRKIKGLENAQQEVLDEFRNSNFVSYSLCDDVMKGPTVITRIQNWLDTVGANKTGWKSQIDQFFYWTKMVVTGKRPGYKWELKHFIKFYTPVFLLKFIGARRN
jgi:FkbM family methyltransferase